MDNSKEFQSMLDKAFAGAPLEFENFDRTKNVQDQLQEMVREGGIPQKGRLVYRFYGWLQSLVVEEDDPNDNYFSNPNLKYESLEQLWLAFVMKEKYNKTWDGESWIQRPS